MKRSDYKHSCINNCLFDKDLRVAEVNWPSQILVLCGCGKEIVLKLHLYNVLWLKASDDIDEDKFSHFFNSLRLVEKMSHD